MELSEVRKEIDTIDEQLLTLLCRRMDCSLQVADYKTAHGLPILNEQREQQILERVRTVAEQCGEHYGSAAALVYSTIMDASRSLQHHRMQAGEALRAQLRNAEKELLPPTKARLVCQGTAGAYSHEAADRLFPGAQPRFVESFADVFASIAKDEADYGILPIENSYAGSVTEVYDLVMNYRFTIAAAAQVAVNHCLVALPGTQSDAVTTVYSHWQALEQCADYLTSRGLQAKEFANTAAAARMVAASGDHTIAAIASEKAAELYGLEILDSTIQTEDTNSTRFIAISRQPVLSPQANKISLIFTLPHVTGSLYRILSRFAMAGLNLTKLESRPTHGGRFEYLFYLDFEGSLRDKSTQDMLCTLSEELPVFTFLGNYTEWNSFH